MKNKEIEEFDKKQLEELLKRLKDINNFTGFKNGAFKYYLGKYEADLLLSYIEQLENNRDKAIDYLEKSKLNQLDTHCKYLHIDFDCEKIENIDELIDILKGDSE